jgi:hypothetical protein
VDYVVDDGPQGCSRLHSQTFVGDELTDWRTGNSGSPDLILRRAYEVDRDDLLARADANRVADASTLQSAGFSGGDVFGVESGARLQTALPAGLEFGLELRSPDTAFGEVERRYVVDADGLDHCDVEELDVLVRGPYVSVMAWLHCADTLLGHFLVCDDFDTTVDGDYFKMSAIEGVMSAPKATPTIKRAAQLLTYAACRRLPRVRELADAVDSITL